MRAIFTYRYQMTFSW